MHRTIIPLLILLILTTSLPQQDQLCLTNSLVVGNKNPSDIENWNCKICNPSNQPQSTYLITNSTTDVQCIISVYESVIVLAFRYTNCVHNIWQDIVYPLQVEQHAACDGCKVQAAYANMWGSVRQEVLDDLQAVRHRTGIDTIYLTGLSLGGGLAMIAYIDIHAYSTFRTIKLTTFGAPKVGNQQWASKLDHISSSQSHRYVMNNDPIPNLPQCLTKLCNYKQTGIKIKCYLNRFECMQQGQISYPRYAKNAIKSGIQFLMANNKHPVEGLIAHMEGYPAIYDYRLILGYDRL